MATEKAGKIIGTTVAALLANDAHYACVWSGDSRIYLIRGGTIAQLSRDHTEVAELVAEGVVPGGGLALLRCVDTVRAEEAESADDERTGVQILRRALEAPTRQIAENSAVDGGVVVARMIEGTGAEGFDAGRKQYVDLIEAGIIDPTKVVRIALENAVSVASVLLLTEATMTEIPEEKPRAAAEPDMGM